MEEAKELIFQIFPDFDVVESFRTFHSISLNKKLNIPKRGYCKAYGFRFYLPLENSNL